MLGHGYCRYKGPGRERDNDKDDGENLLEKSVQSRYHLSIAIAQSQTMHNLIEDLVEDLQ